MLGNHVSAQLTCAEPGEVVPDKALQLGLGETKNDHFAFLWSL